jgi:hypothetical protein
VLISVPVIWGLPLPSAARRLITTLSSELKERAFDCIRRRTAASLTTDRG